MEKTITGVVCSFCGCVCDDLEVKVEDGEIKSVKYGCAIAVEKILNCRKHRDSRSLVKENGKFREVSFEEAIDRAARILAESKYPLLYGWSCTSCEAIRVGIELAEELGGVIDNTATVCHGPTLEAVHDVGEPSGTLGQAKNRADLIVYWGCNPLQAHMRHLSRYTAFTKGMWRPGGRKDRKIVVVDARRSETARVADLFLRVEPGKDYELLKALRMAIKDEEFEQDKIAGVPVEQIEELADLMVSCEFGFLFFGLGLTQSGAKSENVTEAISLIRDLNFRTKWLLMPMRGHFNVTGANKISLWQTGYPFSVDFSHGYPRYNPGESSAVELLIREEVDAALIVGADPAASLPLKAVKFLSRIPVIVVDPIFNTTALVSTVKIPCAFTGIECEGVVYRMDGVPFKAKKLVEPPPGILPDYEILGMLLERVRSIRGA